MDKDFKALQQFIAGYDTLAVVCHKRPDGDALGSLLAWTAYLEAQGKKAEAYCFDAIPDYFKVFLPNIERVRRQIDNFWREAPAVVLIDCGDLIMPGVGAESFAGKRLAVIDHHASNPRYAEVNCLDAAASATAELIFRYFEYIGFAIDKKAATQLLTGIYTDTDAFSNLGTTPEALRAASLLLKRGANFKDVIANTLQNKSIASLKLWGRSLERLSLDKAKGIAITVIREADIKECQARPEDTEGIAGLLNHLADVKMAMVLREQGDGMVKGSLRTTDELIDVSKIAKLLGGGGHTKAAGFTVKGRIIETEKGWKIID